MNNEGSQDTPTIIIVMGVSGCGKSTVAEALAKHYAFTFLDADDFHSEENKAHMAAGKPLTDVMRLPWIYTMREYIQTQAQLGNSCTLAYSGLRKAHRNILRDTDMKTIYIYLHGSKELIAERLAWRNNHFMANSLIDSQFESLEDPRQEKDVITIEIDRELSDVLQDIYGKIAIFPDSPRT